MNVFARLFHVLSRFMGQSKNRGAFALRRRCCVAASAYFFRCRPEWLVQRSTCSPMSRSVEFRPTWAPRPDQLSTAWRVRRSFPPGVDFLTSGVTSLVIFGLLFRIDLRDENAARGHLFSGVC